MNRVNSLSDLLMEEMGDLLDAENQLIKALPEMAQACHSPTLKSFLEDHWETSKEQAYRLRNIFSNIGQHVQGIVCKTMKELIAEFEDLVNTAEKSQARDMMIISLSQRIEHYEITGYGIAVEHATDLGHTRIVELMDKTLNEERAMHLRLSELAQGLINTQALEPKTKQEPQKPQGGFYVQDKFQRKTPKKNKENDVSRYLGEGNPNIQGFESNDDVNDI